MTRTYLYGYGSGPYGSSGTRRDKTFIMSQRQWNQVHPEHMRRLFALADAVQDAGSDYGFAEGRRSSQQQYTLFKSRYTRVFSGPFTLYWNGLPFWPNERGNYLHTSGASAAPPGRSYHEPTTNDSNGYALAADMLGNHLVANPLAVQYGLKHFRGVNGEPWHYQPLEIPNGRKDYNGEFENPFAWPLPGDTPPPPIPNMSRFQFTNPVRIFDSRQSEAIVDHNPHKGSFQVVDVYPHGYTPTDVDGVVLSVLGIGNAAGFFTFWSGEGGAPQAANINVTAGSYENNMVWVPLDAGRFRVFSVAPQNDLVIEEVGWYYQD